MDDGEVLLQELLNTEFDRQEERSGRDLSKPPVIVGGEIEDQGDSPTKKTALDKETHTQWALGGNGKFIPVGSTIPTLKPGIYETFATPGMWGLEKSSIASDGIYLLPDMATEVVLDEVKKFWSSEAKYRAHNLLYKRGLILWGPPGGGKCLGYNTPVMMSDGSIKKVQDVKIGDLIMGDDSKPRTILSLASGKEMMYRISPVKGDSYIVNESHILSLKRHGRTSKLGLPKTDIIDISVKDYINSSNTFKNRFKGYRVGVSFQEKPVKIDPYFLGLWLGDGTSTKPSITTMDMEVVSSINAIASQWGLSVRSEKAGGKAKTYHITSGEQNGKKNRNPLLVQMKSMNLISNKHIPQVYLINSSENRLALLAGLLDSDGYLHNNFFEITSKFETLANDITYLSRSLGFAAYITEKKKASQNGTIGQYWQVSISGNVSKIPTKLPRKQATTRQQIKDVLVTGITVEPIGYDSYYGFEIDGNRRFLLGDFTVTHNTVAIKLLMNELVKKDGIVILAQSIPLLTLCLKAIRRIEPKRNLIVVLEDIDEIININGESSVLSLLDGENNIDNVLHLATTNYPDRLGARIMNRPSRFDRRVFVGMPSPEARQAYIDKATNKQLNPEQLAQWVLDTEEMSIAHLRELVAAAFCLDQPYKDVIKRLQDMAKQVKVADEFKSNSLGFRSLARMAPISTASPFEVDE